VRENETRFASLETRCNRRAVLVNDVWDWNPPTPECYENQIAAEKLARERAEAALAATGYHPVEIHDGNCNGNAPSLVCLGCEQAKFERWNNEAEAKVERLRKQYEELQCQINPKTIT
jgi:hypothetical protein